MTRLLGADPHQFVAESEEAESQIAQSLARAVLADGVTTRSGAAFLTSGLRRNAHLFRADDLTGSQAAINSIHLDQFVHGDRWVPKCVWQGVQLARASWIMSIRNERHCLEFVISAVERSSGTLRSLVFSFYQRWPDEPPWLAEDLVVPTEACSSSGRYDPGRGTWKEMVMALPSTYQSVTCEYGPRDHPLIDLIDDWGNRVLEFLYDIEQGKDTNDGSAWNEYDLVGTCVLRDVIQRCIDTQLAADFRSSTLRSIEEMFRSFTYLIEPDICEITAQRSDHRHGDHWWWHRDPRRGALADELAAVIHTHPELNRFAGSDPTIEEMLALFDGRRPLEEPGE